MALVEQYYIYFVIIYLLHSQEEIYTHFEKVWPLWRMSREFFITMEVLLSILLISVIFIKIYPYRIYLMSVFNLLMFANGIWHITGAVTLKKYTRFNNCTICCNYFLNLLYSTVNEISSNIVNRSE